MFCMAENIVHGGLSISIAGLISLRRRMSFSRILGLLNSHDSSFSCVEVRSNKTWIATSLVRNLPHTADTLNLYNFKVNKVTPVWRRPVRGLQQLILKNMMQKWHSKHARSVTGTWVL